MTRQYTPFSELGNTTTPEILELMGKHQGAMTREDLHSKMHIAFELAKRDARILELECKVGLEATDERS